MKQIKKKYMMPKTEEIEIKMTSMLCVSGDFGDDADEPALSPLLGDDIEDDF
ncbi:MAG: hypothetical protein IJ804_10720 [Prevotella sp.]|nr:hypothetical protein [Prevotella sp.]